MEKLKEEDKMIREKLLDIIVEVEKNIDKSKVINDVNLINDLGFDSISFVKLVCLVEEKFGITIEDEELDFDILASFDHVVKLVEKKLA